MLDLKALLTKILNMSLYDIIFTPILNGGGVGYVRFKGIVSKNIKHLSRVGDSKNLYCFWKSLQHILRNNFNRRNANRIYANSNSKSFAKPSSFALLSLASSRQHGSHRCIARDFKRDDIFTLNYNRRSIYQNKLNSLTFERGCLAC